MTQQATYRAIRIREPGGPEVLELTELPRPAPGAGEVLVRVAASGLNRADLLQRRGLYPGPEGCRDELPGLEYAGTVEEVGEGVDRWKAGDAVMGIVGGEGCAELVVVPADQAIRAPAGLPLERAAGIPEAFITAWDALFLQVGLGEGERSLIHAVGSGVGTAALQLVRDAGARAIGTSRTPEKVDRALELGLSHGIVADGEWADAVLAHTGGAGVEVIVDLVGAAYVEGNQRVLGRGGRWIVVGVPSGTSATLDLRVLMTKRAWIGGTVLRPRSSEEKAALAGRFEREIVPLFEAGRLRPVVDRVLPAEQVVEAHRALEENANFGKIILRW